jgi:hypothetical protein
MSKTVKATKFNSKGQDIGNMLININEIGPVTYLTIERASGEGNSTKLCVRTEDLRSVFAEVEQTVTEQPMSEIERKLLDIENNILEAQALDNRYQQARFLMETFHKYRNIRNDYKNGHCVLSDDEVERLKQAGTGMLKMLDVIDADQIVEDDLTSINQSG